MAIAINVLIKYVFECGGKMHLREGEFEKAHTDFFEAFKNYDESGSPRRTTCLKYLVLANMEHIEDLLRNIRTQVLIKLIKPYTRIQIPFISTELNIDVSEVESLLVSCILDK
ncbi:hypothetical protein NQ317_010822 [Molorchus minor]|uniref:PCI domain-containing protein n=1 Tax=Molorchus minor TaxID=1323400 RepID=A0ABQ9IVS7_9CUCU|nr:hypothetical protein NQ317_010822 [Molorchus minor]